MTTSNLKAVRLRDFHKGAFDRATDEAILYMRDELQEELQIIRADLRDLAAKRNGLARIELEIMLREL